MQATSVKAILTLALFVVILLLLISTLESPPNSVPSEKPAAAAADASEAVVFSLATSGNWSDSYQGTLVQAQIKALAEAAGQPIKLRLYDRNQLGDDLRIVTGVQLGTIDIVSSVPSTQSLVVPEAALMDIPGLFSTLEQFNLLMAGEYLDVMQGYYNAAGLQLLTVYAYSYRQMSCKFPIRNLSDLSELRLRIVENKYQEAFWKALGAIPTPYSFNELYFVLSQDIVQAQENPVDILLSERLMDLQNNIILTNHLPMVQVLVMNKSRYDGMDIEAKAALEQFCRNLRASMIANMPQKEAVVIETLQSDYGMTVIYPEKSLTNALYSANSSVLAMLREDLGDEKVERFLAAVQKTKSSLTGKGG